MTEHLSKGNEIHIIVIENTGAAFTFTSKVLDEGTATNRMLHITEPTYEGVVLDLALMAGHQLLLVFESVLKNDPVYIAYAAYYDSTLDHKGNTSFTITLHGTPKIMRKRNSKRLNAELEMHFKIIDSEYAPNFYGKTVDISAGGLKFKTHKLINRDTIPIVLRINGHDIELDGVIRSVESSRDDSAEYLYRVAFVQDIKYIRSSKLLMRDLEYLSNNA